MTLLPKRDPSQLLLSVSIGLGIYAVLSYVFAKWPEPLQTSAVA